MSNPAECAHVWISNSGQGGEPVYRPGPNGPMAPYVVNVRCSLCNARTWLSRERWEALPQVAATVEKS